MISIMRRRIAVGMLGLAMAGCAESRSALPAKAKPVGVETGPHAERHDQPGNG